MSVLQSWSHLCPIECSAEVGDAHGFSCVVKTGAYGTPGCQRLQFTLHCQLCGEHYQRSTDLSAHLQQTHGSLWTKAGEMVRFMLQTMISKTGCLCNPNTNDRGRTHICNLVYQVAMIYHISEMELLIPWRYSEDEVRLATKASKPGPSNRSINCCSMCSWIGTSVTSGMHRDFCSCSETGASAVEAGIIRLS